MTCDLGVNRKLLTFATKSLVNLKKIPMKNMIYPYMMLPLQYYLTIQYYLIILFMVVSWARAQLLKIKAQLSSIWAKPLRGVT